MKHLNLVFLGACCAWGQGACCACAQGGNATPDAALTNYAGPLSQSFAEWNNQPPGQRPIGRSDQSLHRLWPGADPYRFVAYVMDTQLNQSAAMTSLAQQIQQIAAQGQVNKMIGSAGGSAGSTSLVSSSVAADVLSVATEYGAIAQTNTGNVTTVRANLLGVSGLIDGKPYLGCQSLADGGGCDNWSRWLRGFSSSLSIEAAASATSATAAGTNAATGAPLTAAIPAGGNRMNAWGLRFDWFRKTLYDSPQITHFAAKWQQAMAAEADSPTETELQAAIQSMMDQPWMAALEQPFLQALQNAPAGALGDTLRQQLDTIIRVMAAQDPQFLGKVARAQAAILQSFVDRDDILRNLQSNKFSTEFNATHPLGQPNLSSLRAIYSYEPAAAPFLITANFAVEWYDSLPSGVNLGRLRDLQAAAQLDRTIPQLGSAVFTAAFYYQWMIESALFTIPGEATFLAPKGGIAIGQAKLTLPVKSGIVSVPLSFTWSNRTELIDQSERRGQIGLLLDLDTFFAK